MIPNWFTFFPVRVTAARSASMKPVFVASPLPTSTAPTYTSSPRRLGSVLECATIPTWRPAARIVWPSGVDMVPALVTLGATNATLPPTCSGVVGLERMAPGWTVMSPSSPLGVRGADGLNAGIDPLETAGIASCENMN